MLDLHAVPKPILGVLVNTSRSAVPISEPRFCRQLTRIGNLLGIQVAAFHAEGIHPELKRIDGFVYDNETWHTCNFSLPNIIYNRCFHRLERRTALSRLRHMSSELGQPCTFLSSSLPGKWKVYLTLRHDARLSGHLPLTVQFRKDRLWNLLSKHQSVFLKPQSGSHGKRTIYLQKFEDVSEAPFFLRGRDHSNQPFSLTYSSFDEAYDWIATFIRGRPYIIQPFLELYSSAGRPFDVRTLVQKDGTGQWTLTGAAVREGEPGSLISNLHGGGTAREAASYLQNQFGAQKAYSILENIKQLSMFIPPVLESRHGRLGELGIDFGIDRSGQLWILEVNSKPGRTVFTEIGDQTSASASVIHPLLYARYLMHRYTPAAIRTGTHTTFQDFS